MQLPGFGARRVPYIAQLEAVECGAAALAMVLAFHGHHAPLSEIREMCAVSRDGVSALAMLRAARHLGLEAEAYRTEPEGLQDVPLPAILHWEFNHFVVLERLEPGGRAHLVDPAHGRVTVTREQLGKAFTGAVLAFAPTPALAPRPRKPPELGRYGGLLRAHAGSIGQLVVLSLMLQAVGLIFPVAQQILVDQVLVPGLKSWLWGLALALGVAALVQAALQFVRGWVLDTLSTMLDLRLLGDFMRHVVRLPMGFFLQRHPGDLLQRLESNSNLRAFLGSQIVASLLDVVLLVGYGALMLAYHWQLALLVMAIGCIAVAFQLVVRHLNRQAVSAELAANSGAGNALLESLYALETIKAVSAEASAARRSSNLVIRRANASLPRLRLENATSQLAGFLNAMGLVAVCSVAGQEVIGGTMSIGVFSAFLTLQAMFLLPLNSMVQSLEHWQYLGSHLARLDDVMAAAPEPNGSAAPAALKGEIRLSGVGFRYSPGSAWVLQDVDVHIGAGKRVAVVGPSGAGKSTLAGVLLGMLLPEKGSVAFDGKDIRTYDLARLRARIGAVLQETALLNDTVAANVSLNDPSLSLAQVRNAVRLAQLDDVIESLPHGYATRLGDGGNQLSGGERQRLCLARALVHEPAILLLDEATSALDADTENRVHRNLAALGCTRIVIAHRFATVRDADHILVLDQGRIVQQGSFAELGSQPGLFRTMWRAAGGDRG